MRISIVIPAKNESQYLPNLLESIKKQTMKEYETILADAHSTDRTREIALSFGARVVQGGLPGHGRNVGASHAKGEWILFLDADAVLPSRDFLENCLNELKERDLDIAGCRVLAHEGDRLDHILHGAFNAYSVAMESILPHAPGFCLFARRSVHTVLQGFDETIVFAEDHDYARRAKRMGFHFGIMRTEGVPVSVRRIHSEGRAQTIVKYFFTELHMLTRGPLYRLPFKYEWGKFEKK